MNSFSFSKFLNKNIPIFQASQARKQHQIGGRAQFVVEIVFSIMSTKIRQQRSGDIENLSKPVVDTFFKS